MGNNFISAICLVAERNAKIQDKVKCANLPASRLAGLNQPLCFKVNAKMKLSKSKFLKILIHFHESDYSNSISPVIKFTQVNTLR